MQTLKLARPSALYTPRPDLSTRAVRVEEFRVRAFDGLRLFGLCGHRSMAIGKTQVRLRMLPHDTPADRPTEIDLSAVRSGVTEYVLRCPEGRKLEDRVLDVLRVCELAAAKEGIRTHEVVLFTPEAASEPDEFLIAAQLISGEIELGAE